ncbi:MAG TPA: hypothetical protein ENK50_04200 [Sedimenticola sp.]|nr:hypothetical protein [Sedimenticola sp.]
MLTALLLLLFWWCLILVLLWFWKGDLFRRTWREPYFADTPVLIESDDWGPGGDCHTTRLRGLLACLARHRDSSGRRAVLTADTVLAVPDIPAIRAARPTRYRRRYLDDAFPAIHAEMRAGMAAGTLVPQLHGLEHLNGDAFAALYATGDPRVQPAFGDDGWWDWESLDSPLQGHYVDGSRLPTTPLPRERAEAIVNTACDRFERMFGQPSRTTVAPCYLWNDAIEDLWRQHGITAIQTAGYRCTGRDANGHYHQDPPLIRPGERSASGQIYLVRNVMYEPVDGRNTPESALDEAMAAVRQALPVTLSTHRYNYTRDEGAYRTSLEGLDRLLTQIEERIPGLRYLASPELAAAILAPEGPVRNAFNGEHFPPLRPLQGRRKVAPFLQRLWRRHPKLRLLAAVTGLALPLFLAARFSSRPSR